MDLTRIGNVLYWPVFIVVGVYALIVHADFRALEKRIDDERQKKVVQADSFANSLSDEALEAAFFSISTYIEGIDYEEHSSNRDNLLDNHHEDLLLKEGVIRGFLPRLESYGEQTQTSDSYAHYRMVSKIEMAADLVDDLYEFRDTVSSASSNMEHFDFLVHYGDSYYHVRKKQFESRLDRLRYFRIESSTNENPE